MEKKIISTCIANPRLNSLIKEVVSNNSKEKFKIEILDRDNLFRNDFSFIIVDEEIYFEIIKQKIIFDKIILIKTSNRNIKNFSKESEITALEIPFRFNDLYKIITNRINLMSSHSKRVQEFNKFTYDPRLRVLFNKDFSIRFTEKESNIFEYMLMNCNQFISKKVLLKEIWSYTDAIDTHTLETHIYSLRKKIGKNLTLQDLIKFEERKGYYLNKNLL
tara:strand:- start:1634 stop:2290 length:657 start_codon:yes stop_codon:yes gene_type:complete